RRLPISTLFPTRRSSDLNFNLYDKSGKLLYSSQPRIFDLKLVSEYINPTALNKLAVLRKSEAYEQEQISNFRFSSAYAAIKNERSEEHTSELQSRENLVC